jgi:hypothetical protein
MPYDLNACGLVTICGLRVNHNAGDYFTCFNNTNEINHYTTAGASSTMYLNYVGGDVSVARNAMYLKNAGNVGIGTTSPGAQFTIEGTGPGSGLQDGQVQIRTTTAANPSAIGFINSGNTPSFNDLAWIRAIITAGNARGSLSFVTRDSDGGNTGVAERMRITNGGSVGIGTSSPTSNAGLTVKRPTDTGWIIDALNGSNVRMGGIYSTGGNNGQFYLGNSVGTETVLLDSAGTSYLNGGNVGIGTTSPGSELQIVGPNASGADFGAELRVWENSFGVTLQGSTKGNTYAFLGNFRYNFTTETNSVTSYFRSGHGLLFKDGVHIFSSEPGGTSGCIFTPSERFTINNSGNVGIGSTSPSTKLYVACGLKASGTTELVWIGTCDASQPLILSFKAVGGVTSADRGMQIISTEAGVGGNFLDIGEASTRTRFFSNGNVNIGSCATTSYRLNVNGSFYAAGSSIDYKEGICQYNTDSCLFMCLKPKAYQYKEEWKHLGKDLKSGTQIGLIAEEVAESHPELAVLVNEEDNQVVRNVDYEKLSIILLAEVQKLRQEVDQLNQK